VRYAYGYNRDTMRWLVLLGMVLVGLACGDGGEEIPTDDATAALNEGAVIVCPRVGAAASGPTPRPSCEPGADVGELGGILPSVTWPAAEVPAEVPVGYRAISAAHRFSLDTRGVVALPLDAVPPADGPVYFYTFQQGEWRRIAEAGLCVGASCGIEGAAAVAQATLDPVPSNVVALIEEP
jgi:hypothetical protein